MPVTLVHVDAHLDWRHEVNGETEGYSSPIRRAAEMPWIDKIVQIGLRGIGSARDGEVKDAINYGAEIIDANGMDLVEIAPRYDVGNITMVHAERLICNFIGAAVRAGYYEG